MAASATHGRVKQERQTVSSPTYPSSCLMLLCQTDVKRESISSPLVCGSHFSAEKKVREQAEESTKIQNCTSLNQFKRQENTCK